MNINTRLLISLLMVFPFALFSTPDEKEKQTEKTRPFPNRLLVLSKFDADKDGKLNDQERENLRQGNGG